MKFGKQLANSELPEYKGQYLDYNRFKTELKQLRSDTISDERTERRVSANFFAIYQSEKDRLNAFVEGEFSALNKRLAQLRKDVTEITDLNRALSPSRSGEQEFYDIQFQVLELQKAFIRLEQFVNLNYTAIAKILKKHDKVTRIHRRSDCLRDVEKSSFYSKFDSAEGLEALKDLNDQLTPLHPPKSPIGPRGFSTTTATSSSTPSLSLVSQTTQPITPTKDDNKDVTAPKSSIYAFMVGTFVGQAANNIAQILMPLVLFLYTTSSTRVGLVLTLTSVSNALGSFFGGWLFGAVAGARYLLFASNLARSLILSLAAFLLWTNRLSFFLASSLFCLDYAVLGVIDTVRNAAPSSFVGNNREALNKFNTHYQIAFDLGSVLGPLVAGVVIQFLNLQASAWIAPVLFVLVAANSLQISSSVKEEGATATNNSPLAAVKALISTPLLTALFMMSLTLQMYRIKGSFSALYAEGFTANNETNTAWLMAAFGLGGLIGALLYGRSSEILSDSSLAAWGWAGLLALAISWLPGDIWFAGVSIVFFAATNVLSRLCFQSKLQSVIKRGGSGGIMGLNRTGVKIVTAIQQFSLAISFTIAQGLLSLFESDDDHTTTMTAFGLFSLFILFLGLLSFGAFYWQRIQEEEANELELTERGQNADDDDDQNVFNTTGRALDTAQRFRPGSVNNNNNDKRTNRDGPTSSTHLIKGQDREQQQNQEQDETGLRQRKGLPKKSSKLSEPVLAPSSSVHGPISADEESAAFLRTPRTGAFLVFEGVDGSGKSTQLDWLASQLSAKGYDVVVTRWNSSQMLSQTIKRAKRAQKLTPITFSIMQAGDAAEQLKEVVLPSLQRGKLVLSDRYYYTSLARDSVRGMDPTWLRSLFRFAVDPDLVIYFKVPVTVAISRVLKRRLEIQRKKEETKLNKLKSSTSPSPSLTSSQTIYASAVTGDNDSDAENGSDDEENGRPAPAAQGRPAKKAANENALEEVKLNFYEAGLDLKLAEDPLENFQQFQQRVMSKYDAMTNEFGFKVIDATRSREDMFTAVQAFVREALTVERFPDMKRCLAEDPLCLARANFFDVSPDEMARKKSLCLSVKNGARIFFRLVLLPMRLRFTELADLNDAPVVLLHGNPHVDNYAGTRQGLAMIDFDRSCYGPYPFDLVRLLVSMSISQLVNSPGFLPASVVNNFKEGYLRGCVQPQLPFIQMRSVRKKSSSVPLTTTEYLASNRGWAKELKDNIIWQESDDDNDGGDVLSFEEKEDVPESETIKKLLFAQETEVYKKVRVLVREYLTSRADEKLLETSYRITHIATAKGSLGLERYLVVLSPNEQPLSPGLRMEKDQILLDLKPVIPSDPVSPDGLYINPFEHNGVRMITASKLYAPGFTLDEGYATIDGVQYYGRRIPPWKDKIKGLMDEDELCEFALAVGSQLGRAHRLSVGEKSVPGQKRAASSDLGTHFRMNFGSFLTIAEQLRLELSTCYNRFIQP